MKYFVEAKLSENISETPEGFLICLGVPIARTGEMLYGAHETPLEPDASGKVKVMREDAEVFRPETIASFEGKPITITHPDEFVNPDNWKDLAKGTMQNVRRGTGEYKDSLLADLLITDRMAIELVKNGLREVSCGYEADYEQEDGAEGSGFQRNIIGNHLALVDQGRAGPSYAINDHKGVDTMTFQEKVKAFVSKVTKDAESLGGEQSKQDPSSGKPAVAAKDAYDELVKMKENMDALMAGMDAMMKSSKPKDEAVASVKEKENAEGGKQANDDDPMAAMEERLKACEAALKKLMSAKSGDEEEMEDADEEEAKDADEDKEEKAKDADEEMEDADEESEDDDFEKSSLVGDTASRAEILAPGIKLTKNVKVKALKAAYATVDGAKVIKAVNGGKAPTYDSKEKVNMLFIAASELLKAQRSKDLSRTKVATRTVDGETVNSGYKTPEELNEINAKHYQNQNRH